MKKLSRLTALLLTLTMLVTSMPLMALANTVTVDIDTWNSWVEDAQNAAANQTETVTSTVTVTGETSVVDRPVVEAALTAHEGVQTSATQAVKLPIAGKLVLKAYDKASSYQWQVKAGSQWANIVGDKGASTTLTYAKIQNAISGGVAQVRCVMVVDGQDYVSATAQVTVDDTVTYTTVETESTLTVTAEVPVRSNYALRSSGATTYAGTDSKSTYNVVVNFLFENNEIAADPYTASLAAGSNFSATVTFPTVQGYLPYLDEVQQNSTVLNYTNIDEDYTINVVYKPTNVDYTVIHYQQNQDNDNYTEAERETKQDLTGKTVDDVAKTYEGFYALLYEKPAIAADGSTVVEVYYDRYYYLMNFDLDGGYGVEPIYARYGTPIGNVGTPTKAGYVFQGWSLNGGEASMDLPSTMPAENRTYVATWAESDSSFTVVYWLQNADDDEYSVFGSATIDATTGETVKGADYITYSKYIDTDSNFQEVEPFIEYKTADGEITVAGDKSSVVNVYYTRKAYTLKFYYAMEDTTNSKYYVIGGSSYAFGASGSDVDDSIDNLTNYYMDGGSWVSNRGQVDEIPGLNSIGTSRKYLTGYDTDTKTVGNWLNQTTYNYNYYYISFSAKYGADISELWPCNVFNSVTRVNKDNTNGWSGTEAFVSAWNGEHHVYYSQHNSNQTIKGNYNQLDTQLLWDYSQFGAYADSNNTVDFLCFWENGANVDWSVPELYRYMVWVPVLDGQDTTGLTTKDYNGISYYLRNTYDTVDDSDYDHQTAPAINGLTYQTYDWNTIDNPDSSLYSLAYEVHFYYTRNQYNLSFQNDGVTEKTDKVDFEADLSEYQEYEPSYPDMEADAYEFEGWYTTSTFVPGTKFEFDGKTMPANDLMLYAHWVPKIHTVRFYLDKGAMEANTELRDPVIVLHGSKVDPVPENPTNGSYTFVGWFYMDNGVEKAFDFANMPVNKDLQVYGKWSSNVLKEYTVYYKIQGTDTEIADATTGSGLAGVTKTFEAKGGTDLYANYQEGYFPVTKSHSMTIDINATEENKANVYTFWYVEAAAVPYTVYYVTTAEDAVGDKITLDGVEYTMVATTKQVNDNHKAVVTEQFAAVSGYLPDAYQKRLVVSVDENGNPDTAHNVIIFYYTKDDKHAYYKITHYTENLAKDAQGKPTWTEYASSQAVGDIGSTYTADAMNIPGFTFDKNVAGTVQSGKLTANGLELKLYYTRNSYPYQVRYLEQGTGKQLADPKNDEGKYGEVISESAISIPNYTAVAPTSQTLNIHIEEGTEAKLNIITFYYTENEATINYQVVGPTGCGTVSLTSETLKVLSGTAQGSTATANENFKFVGWYTDADCETPVDSTWVDANNTITPVKASDAVWADVTTYYAKFVVDKAYLTIKKSGMDSGESAIINVSGPGYNGQVVVPNNGSVILFVTCGDYTITEVGSWTNRYTTTVTGLTQEGKVTLTATGAEVSFTNTKKNDKWLHDESAIENFTQTGTGN